MARRFFYIAFLCAAMLYCLPAYADDCIWINGNIRNADEGDAIDYADAPLLCFEANSGRADIVNAEIVLNGAVWRYDEEGTISRGITYTIEDEYIMNLTIDSDASNFWYKDIEIPLYIKITGEGYIRISVSTDDGTIDDFDDELTVVKCSSKNISLGSAAQKIRFGGTAAFTYTDDTKQSYPAGTKMNVSLTGDFYFVSVNKVNGTGKFENRCKFEISEKDPSKAVITITKDTPAKTGKIGISGIQIQKDDKEIYNTVMLSLKLDDDGVYTSFSGSTAIAQYSSSADDVRVEATTETTTEATTEAETEASTQSKAAIPNTVLTIPIGQAYYAIGDDVYETDAPAYISSDNYTMLPIRTVANALGVDDSKILYNSKTFTATLIANDKTITITKGQKSISIDGVPMAIDTAADIQNSRLYVPVRAMANAFGISNDKIMYDSGTNMVMIDMG